MSQVIPGIDNRLSFVLQVEQNRRALCKEVARKVCLNECALTTTCPEVEPRSCKIT
ncbi:uncharacterized protein PHALS_03099 [Plasmopara halstedii]|uniref:Uncharacterized protein n=1 Tax=Plasmopara halstedii TaxID=4781 RepID=A0A0P1A7U3_PLAHL|nr:uncharacterized protein PHALS_03099 [Plasmopara halstedii]CEG36551.1 hypothetical protein PHALS_03099 [Plasmopara halstedii]|eukprot:XP_024572920.1 hypothetical protein PHALS_03099 [Plasmopara halstedii]